MDKTYIQKINESKAQDLIDFLEDYFKNIYAFYCEQNDNQSSIIIKDMPAGRHLLCTLFSIHLSASL
jgi:hypothetical protein